MTRSLLAAAGCLIVCLSLALYPAGSGEESGSDRPPGEISFRRDVLPILEEYGCTGCHGGDGGLTVTTAGSLRSGGDNGPAVVPGNPGSSLLLHKLSETPRSGVRMPPDGPYPPAGDLNAIRSWIEAGAKDN